MFTAASALGHGEVLQTRTALPRLDSAKCAPSLNTGLDFRKQFDTCHFDRCRGLSSSHRKH
eukprot:s721_g38.t1